MTNSVVRVAKRILAAFRLHVVPRSGALIDSPERRSSVQGRDTEETEATTSPTERGRGPYRAKAQVPYDHPTPATPDVSIGKPHAPCLLVLTARGPDLANSLVLLNRDVFRIGTASDNDLVVNDDSVARHHLQIQRRDDAEVLVVLDAKHAVLLNDKRIARDAVLETDDRIRIGSTIFKYISGWDAQVKFYAELLRVAFGR